MGGRQEKIPNFVSAALLTFWLRVADNPQPPQPTPTPTVTPESEPSPPTPFPTQTLERRDPVLLLEKFLESLAVPLEKDDLPQKILIPRIGLGEEIQILKDENDQDDIWITPDEGIAFVEDYYFSPNGENNLILFGHSQTVSRLDKPSRSLPWAKLFNLSSMDKIFLEDQNGRYHLFEARDFYLVSRDPEDLEASKVWTGSQNTLRLTLLTTAKYQGRWLMPLPEVRKRLERKVLTVVPPQKDIGQAENFSLVIIARPVPVGK